MIVEFLVGAALAIAEPAEPPATPLQVVDDCAKPPEKPKVARKPGPIVHHLVKPKPKPIVEPCEGVLPPAEGVPPFSFFPVPMYSVPVEPEIPATPAAPVPLVPEAPPECDCFAGGGGFITILGGGGGGFITSTPTAPVPEPEAWLTIVAGLLFIARRKAMRKS